MDFSAYEFSLLQQGQFRLHRGVSEIHEPILLVACSDEYPSALALQRLEHEHALSADLDAEWAARPVELVHREGRLALVLEDPGGEPLQRMLGRPMDITQFLRIAIPLATVIGRAHAQGLVHKDIVPANILVDVASGSVRLTGFGIASRLPRERQGPGPPEEIAGTLAYMAPEQTGRMNRSVDSRSDLYACGVTFYEMLTGALPFTAADPMEWIHCHIARQPMPPGERVDGIPASLSAIVMKLLSKSAEDRYQTAAGLEADLRKCLAQWEAHGRIEPFPLGMQDASDRLMIPERLYGREREIDALLGAFDRVVASGATELVLVSGYSGIGKSSVVNELQKALVPPRGLFASGKFDQYKRNIPYATLAQAFQSLVRHILGKGEVELGEWRDALREALGANGALIVNLVPELELVVGKQPPVAELPPRDAKNRFQMVFRRFLGAFARKERPLALFLDDLQWLDAATLDLIEHVVTHPDVLRLLLVAAYRDNEVGPAHPLMRTLEAIRNAGASVHEIVLAPLRADDVVQLISDGLHCEPKRARPLARLVYDKTGGNPFFAIQFITTLADEGLLAFDAVASAWRWDMERIHAKSYTDNVVDLMVGKLKRLSATTQEGLKQLACLGNVAETATLAMVYGRTEEAIHTPLWQAVHAGLVVREEGAYKFAHDRIQQAAYSLIPESRRAEVHLRIGRALLASMTADQLAEHLFDVENQFNRAAGRLIDRDERAQVATIHLRAGRKAKASAAYASACAYFAAGVALLDESDWNSRYELTFSLRLELAECEFVTGDFEGAEQLIAALLQRAASKIDMAAAYNLDVLLLNAKSETTQALAKALKSLRLFGIDIPARPTFEHLQVEYEAVWRNLDGRPIESLIDLPLMIDPERQAVMQVLTAVTQPAYHADFHLNCLLAARMVNITLQQGICSASVSGLSRFGRILGPVFQRYAEGYRFAKLGRDLFEKHGFIAPQARVYFAMGTAAAWTQPMAIAIETLRTSFRIAIETGVVDMACYSLDHVITFLLVRNDPLDAVWRESEKSLEFVRKAGFADVAAVIVSQQRFIATMRAQTATFSTFSDEQFDEAEFELQLIGNRTTTAVCLYWILKLKARFLSGDYAEAFAAGEKAGALLWAAPLHIQLVDYFYYCALTVAALYGNGCADKQKAWRDLLAAHQEQLRKWAENYPPTFADKHALASAEIARLEGRDLDAMRLYEEAIRAARDNGFVQNEGVALEAAARFYEARDFETSARAHLQNARNCYRRWGAEGKVRQLDRLHPFLREHPVPPAPVGALAEQLEVAGVIKASQAVSTEIVLDRLIETLMTIALEHAGAQRGLLVLMQGDTPNIEAAATTNQKSVVVTVRQEAMTPAVLPEFVLNTVIRMRQSVILNDAWAQSSFSADPYILEKRARSVLCLPLLKQTRLIGVLYLENSLASHVFTPARISLLELLASQAAISLENARLYGELTISEERWRKLFESVPVGVVSIGSHGRYVAANPAFQRMTGYSEAELLHLSPTDVTHEDDRALAEANITASIAGGPLAQRVEKRYRRKDGGITWAELSLFPAPIVGSAHQLGGIAVDITERKRAEEALRVAQAELAHAARLTTLGELTASIAHEVNQPLTGIITYGGACLRWLDRETPRLDQARSAVEQMIMSARLASEVIARTRGLSKKGALERRRLDVNQLIDDVIALIWGEINAHQISLRADLASPLTPVLGDRVQLQQVVMNLLMNGIQALSSVTGRRRDLQISSRGQGNDQILVAVEDSGIGIAPENVGRLFDSFFTTKPDGMGMGLSICKSIIEQHGGRIWVTRNSAAGSTFQFTLNAGNTAPA